MINLRDYGRTAAQRGWGAGWPTNRAADMATVVADRSGTKLVVHKRIARLVDLLVDSIERDGYLLVPGWCWGFANRAISGTQVASNHSWGLAIDINAPKNPYTTSGVHDLPDWVARRANRYGFAWGGDYSGARKDFMHLEFMGTPEDALTMIALAERELGVGGSAPTPAPAPTPVPPPAAPPFPLPAGFYYGPRSGPRNSISGLYRTDTDAQRDGLRRWQQRMRDRGWRNMIVDGLYGNNTRDIATAFQREKGLAADGLIGPRTWTAAWTAPIT